jgi:hypothetical protein
MQNKVAIWAQKGTIWRFLRGGICIIAQNVVILRPIWKPTHGVFI